jgi:hypothetical protein
MESTPPSDMESSAESLLRTPWFPIQLPAFRSDIGTPVHEPTNSAPSTNLVFQILSSHRVNAVQGHRRRALVRKNTRRSLIEFQSDLPVNITIEDVETARLCVLEPQSTRSLPNPRELKCTTCSGWLVKCTRGQAHEPATIL